MSERRITAIKVQKHNPDRLNIELDGEFAFGLSRIVAAWLKVGDVLSDERVSSLKSSDASEEAYQKALRLLNYRPRTEFEIRQRLTKKGFTAEDVDSVVSKLRGANLVQDQQYARMWVENRNEFHPRSQRLMRMEMRQKGISERTIDTALVDSANDDELATKAAEKYARKLDLSDGKLFRKRLSAYLSRRGFSYGTISPVVQNLFESLVHDQNQKPEYEDDTDGRH